MKQSRRCRVRKHKRTLKRGNKKKMRGGLFTVDGGDAWAAVIQMMKCKGAALSVISYSSLYGFILLLSIPEPDQRSYDNDCARFKDENGNPLYKIVFKIVLISNEKKKPTLSKFKERKKSVMNMSSFNNEANKQSYIFKEYLSTNPYKKQRTNNIKPITLGVAHYTVFDKDSYDNHFLSLLDPLSKDPDIPVVMKYIRDSMPYVTGLGVIVMNYAGNYIQDNINYEMMTLSKALDKTLIDDADPKLKTNLIHAKNKCCEYSIAQMLIMLLVFKSINTDAHSSNFLTIFYKQIPMAPSLENITTWMIDMGRLVDVKNISNEFNYNYQQYSSQYKTYYKNGPTFQGMCEVILNSTIESLFALVDEISILKWLHQFTTFITVIDCIENNATDGIPQCAFIIEYLMGSDSINDMIHLKKENVDINVLSAKYKRILEYMRFITTESAKYPDIDYSSDVYINTSLYAPIFSNNL